MDEVRNEKSSNANCHEKSKPVQISQSNRTQIAEAAYLKAEKRGFTGGDPVQDWLEAEKEILGKK